MVRQTRKAKKRTQQTRRQRSYWGYHLIVNAGKCDPDALRSAKQIKAFSAELVERIHMKAYGKPLVVRFGANSHVKGYSLVQLIETSNITAHFVEQTNDIYLDIFSCKSFVKNDAIEVFKKYFSPSKMCVQFLKRQAPK